MTDGFVGVILSAIAAIDPDRRELRTETDDLSTLMVGPPGTLFPAMRDLFAHAGRSGHHMVLSAHVSRGCPGEGDDPICATPQLGGKPPPAAERIAAAKVAVSQAPVLGQQAVAKRQHYCENHMLGEVPLDLQGFEAFHKARQNRMRERLTQLLG